MQMDYNRVRNNNTFETVILIDSYELSYIAKIRWLWFL